MITETKERIALQGSVIIILTLVSVSLKGELTENVNMNIEMTRLSVKMELHVPELSACLSTQIFLPGDKLFWGGSLLPL